jgi:hypothetical protein
MKILKPGILVLCAVTAVVPMLSCHGKNPNTRPSTQFTCMNFPQIAPNLPGDVDVPNHPNAQCFAWQQFIALNWLAKPGRAGEPDRSRGPRDFGRPGAATPVVWETYKEAHEVFLNNGAPPRPWGVSGLLESLPSGFKNLAAVDTEDQASGSLVFRMTSKVDPEATELRRIHQAFSNGWLTAQNRKLTYYGIHMNRAEFDYIVSNRFYDAREQRGKFINLPAGRTGRSPGSTPAEGSIEIKSAWVELTDPKLRSRFRTTTACIVEGDGCRMALVGLVGLHIIHKTETFPQWSWATFEHVDNAPDREEIRQGTLKRRYTYFNPRCPTDSTEPQCVPNRLPTPPMDRPVQVVRLTPIPPSSRELNRLVHQQIRRANPDSVWQYYDLVDIQWPEAAETITDIRDIPLPQGGMTPTSVTNATLETYVQHSTCMDCHRTAKIACVGAICSSQAADYSFLFNTARPSP